MSVTFKVTRREKLAQKLFALAPAAEKELAQAALKSAQEIVDYAKQLAPAPGQNPYSDGMLAKSGRARLITGAVRSGKRKSSRVVLDDAGTVAAVAGFDAPHAHLIEFGTTERTHKSGKRVGRVKPQPFLFPAYRVHKKRAKGRLSRAITKSIKNVAKS